MRSRNPLILLIADGEEETRIRWTRMAEANSQNLELHFVHDGEQLLQFLHRQGEYAELTTAPHLVLMSWTPSTPGTKDALLAMKLDPQLKFLPTIVLVENGDAREMIEAYQLGAASCCALPTTDVDVAEFFGAVRGFWGEFVRFPVGLSRAGQHPVHGR